MHLLRRYVDLTALHLSSAVRMSVNGYLVDSAESISILRDDDEIEIHSTPSEWNKRGVRTVEAVTPVDKKRASTGTIVSREKSKAVVPINWSLQSRDISTDSSSDSSDESDVHVKKKRKKKDAQHEKLSAKEPKVSSSVNTTPGERMSMFNTLVPHAIQS